MACLRRSPSGARTIGGRRPRVSAARAFERSRASCSFQSVQRVDETVEQILTNYATVVVVGASTVPAKPAHYVPAHMQQHGWRVVPVNPLATEVLGERAYPTLAEVPEQVGLVNVFRPSRATPEIARQAVAVHATALWLQLGIASEEARAIAKDAGLLYVEDRCLLVEQRRLGLEAPRRS